MLPYGPSHPLLTSCASALAKARLCSRRNPRGDDTGEVVTTKDFVFHNAIGRGAFGKVIKCISNFD